MRRHVRPSTLLPALVLLLAGCARAERGAGGGTVIITSSADADALIPPTRTTIGGKMIAEFLFDPLIEIGPALEAIGDKGYVPRLARSWSWSADSLVITFRLDPAARWHDGQPVVAKDVVAGFAAIKDPANASTLFADLAEIDSVHVIDPGQVSLHYNQRTAEQLYSASIIAPLPAHLVDTIPSGSLATSAFAQAPVGSGPYRFVAREPKVRIELAAVTDHYRGRPGPDRIALVVSELPATAIAKLWTEEADVWDVLPAPDVAEAAKYPHIRLVPSAGFDYAFIGFNFRDPRDTSRAHPILADRRMRHAITMGVDREGLITALFDSLARPGLGPFVRAQWSADTTLAQIPFDTARANALLDSLGWTGRDRDGIRTRNGRTLSLRALVPAPSANRVRASVLVQEQLRRIGVAMPIEKVEGGAFGAGRDAGTWDLIFGGWGTVPSLRGTRTTWGSRRRPGWGRLNGGNYDSDVFNAEVDTALSTLDLTSARRHFRRAYETIIDDAPAVWLYEPVPVNAVHRRFTIPAWRSEAWWRTIPQWKLDPAQRLPRDAAPTTP